MVQSDEALTRVSFRLEPRGSVFVIFREASSKDEHLVGFTRNSEPVLTLSSKPVAIKIQKAIYGILADDSRRRNVRSELQALVDRGVTEFPVGKLNESGDPAYGVVKALEVEYLADGRSFTARAQEPDSIHLSLPASPVNQVAQLRTSNNGALDVVAWEPGKYDLQTTRGGALQADIVSVPPVQVLTGRWDVRFPPKWGAPEKIALDQLVSLSESTNPGVRFFSGTITYTKTFDWKPSAHVGKQKSEIWLELGDLSALAQVKLNDYDLGTVWLPPYRLNITRGLQAGTNLLEVRIANLWRNRMIGDAALPEKERFAWSSSAKFSPDTLLPKSGLLGPVTIKTAQVITLP